MLFVGDGVNVGLNLSFNNWKAIWENAGKFNGTKAHNNKRLHFPWNFQMV